MKSSIASVTSLTLPHLILDAIHASGMEGAILTDEEFEHLKAIGERCLAQGRSDTVAILGGELRAMQPFNPYNPKRPT